MKSSHIPISPSGPSLSRVIAGMWRMGEWGLDVPARVRFIEQCIDLGVTTFDHADIYGVYTVEALFGQALSSSPALKKKIQIITKCGVQLQTNVDGAPRIKHYNLSAQHIIKSVDSSLKYLQVDTIDVLLMHRPSPLMDFDEMADTFKQLHAAGKVQHFGVSNFTTVQFDALNSRYPLVTNQVEFSPLHLQPMDDGVFDRLQDHHVSPMIWSALGGGQLFTGTSAQAVRVQKALASISKATGLTAGAVVYAWIMRLPCKPFPLTGSSRIEAIRDAVAASNVQLDHLHWFELLEAARGTCVP